MAERSSSVHTEWKRAYLKNKRTWLYIGGRNLPVCVKDTPPCGKHSAEGAQIVIIGNEKHPEVKGIKSWSLDPHTAVIATPEEAENIRQNLGKRYVL